MADNAIIDINDAAHGVCSYNGWGFSAFRSQQLVGDDVWDEAERTIVGVRYKLTISDHVQADTEAAAAALMTDLRQKLNEPARLLTLTSMGIGDITVGPGGVYQDQEWGPKPRVINIAWVGGVNAIEIVWTVEFMVSECQSSALGWMACNYTVNYRNDHRGIGERAISGYLQICQSRNQGNVVDHSADEQWDNVQVAVPQNWRRLVNERTVSANRNRLDFTFVDRQLDGPAFPPGIADAKARYSLSNADALVFERWNGRLDATYTVVPGVPKATAAKCFYDLLQWKKDELTAAVRQQDAKNFVMLERIAAENDLYSLEASFSAAFTAVGCLSAVLGPGGLWTPLRDSNYQLWATSMSAVWSNRGTAGLAHRAETDAIVDVCTPTFGIAIGTDSARTPAATEAFAGIATLDIPEDSGWLAYENRLKSEREHQASVHSVVEEYNPNYASTAISLATGVNFDAVLGSPPKVQYHGGPTDRIVMIGKALRVKHQPPVPKLVKVGNVGVTELKAVVDGPKIVGCIMGHPLYFLRWAILYQVDGYLQDVPPEKRKGDCC